MPAKLESLGPRSADGPLRTAVAKVIILPLWAFYVCGGNRRLRSFANAQATSSMAVTFVERRRGQVPLYVNKTNPRHGAEDCINNLYFLWKNQCRYFSICFIDSSNIASSEYRLSIIVLYLALSSFSVGTGLS